MRDVSPGTTPASKGKKGSSFLEVDVEAHEDNNNTHIKGKNLNMLFISENLDLRSLGL